MGTRFVNPKGKNKRSVWTVNTASYKGAHFAVYPPKLIEPCVLAGCPEGGTVLDPFSGSGTTGVVAINNGRKYIGIELNPEYAELSEKRIEDECPHNLMEIME
jgi:DNA modification methylase